MTGKYHKPSQATQLVSLAEDAALWSTLDGEPFATFWAPAHDHVEHWPVRSARFKRHLARLLFESENTAPSSEAIKAALNVIEGRALYGDARHATHVRVAGDDEDLFKYLDLVDERWQAIEVSFTGWRLIAADECPVRFRRSRAMQSLPIPERGGSLEELRDFLNVADDEGFVLAVAWLVGALRSAGPYPLLALHGEQGSGKTVAARLLRALIDPSAAPVRAEPRDPRDLMIAAHNSWVIALDNLSKVTPWLSDALCRLSTGGGYATRTLYADAEETIFDSTRPIILTGIEDLAERGDLIDRSIVLTLPRLTDARRCTEAELWSAFREAHPRILGALLDAVVEAIRNESKTSLSRMPRMADFARWIVAAESRLPWPSGMFLTAYEGNRASANETALEASPIAATVLTLMSDCETWKGSASELLTTIEKHALPRVRDSRAWPKNSRALSAQLRRIAPNLRVAEIGVEFGQTAGKGSRRFIVLTRTGSGSCDASDASDAKEPRASQASTRSDASDANATPRETGDALAELL